MQSPITGKAEKRRRKKTCAGSQRQRILPSKATHFILEEEKKRKPSERSSPAFPKRELLSQRPTLSALAPDRESGERFDRSRLVVFHVKDGVELGDLHDVMDLAGEVEQLHIALMLADGGEGADKGAEAGAVDVGDVVKIEKDLLLAFGEEIGDEFTQGGAFFAEGNLAADVHDGDGAYLANAGGHAHENLLRIRWRKMSLRFGAMDCPIRKELPGGSRQRNAR